MFYYIAREFLKQYDSPWGQVQHQTEIFLMIMLYSHMLYGPLEYHQKSM